MAGAGLVLSGNPLSAIEPIVRKGQARMKLSVAAYSFRRHFRWMKGKAQNPTGRAIDMRQFIDLCADYGCEGTELTSYFFQGDADDAYYLGLKHYAFLRGIEISGTAVGNNFALPMGRARDEQVAAVKAWIDKAAVLGAPHVRVFAGGAKGLDEAQEWEELELCVDSGASATVIGENMLKAIAAQPGKAGVEYEVADGIKIPNLGQKRSGAGRMTTCSEK